MLKRYQSTFIAFGILIFASGIVLLSIDRVSLETQASMQANSLNIYPMDNNLFPSVQGTLQETAKSTPPSNKIWWLNSGGYFYAAASGTAATITGSLPTEDRWRLEYAKTNPIDTDDGYHPQNIFRLVEQGAWGNYTEQAYFLIKNNNLSASPNRNESNGLLLFNRYQDGNNLYYAGIRVDGAAVIKKKIKGVYYTMAYQPVFPGTYDRTAAPNLLPANTWIGLKTEVVTNATGSVTIVLSADVGKTGKWTELIRSTDDGTHYGGAPILTPGHIGIRTDFMDVAFDDFRANNLP